MTATKQKKKAATRYGKNNVSLLFSALLNQVGDKGRDMIYRILREYIDNCEDASRKLRTKERDLFLINMIEDQRVIEIIDKGRGFSENDVDGFLSVFRGDEDREDDITTIGKWGSGRLFAFLVADRITVYTVSSDYPKGITFTLTRDMVEQSIKNDGIALAPNIEPVPPEYGITEHGSVIRIEGVDFSKICRANTVVKHLHEYLSPRNGQLVRLNGEQLSDRSTIGEPFTYVYGEAELGSKRYKAFKGNVEVYLYAPESSAPSTKGCIRLGGANPNLPFAEVAKLLPKEVVAMIPEPLLDDTFEGEILFPALNDYRGSNSASFTPEFYASQLSRDIVMFLAQDLWPVLDKAYQLHVEKTEKQRTQEALQKFCDQLNPDGFRPEQVEAETNVNGGNGRKKRDTTKRKAPPFHVNENDLQLVQGDKFVVEVTRRGQSSGKFTFESSNAGDFITQLSDTKFRFHAASIGMYDFEIVDAEDTSLRRKIEVEVMQESELDLTPSKSKVKQGRKKIIRIAHPESLPADVPIAWKLLGDTTSVNPQVSGDKLSIAVDTFVTTPLGVHTVEVKVGEHTATAEIEVVEPDPNPLMLQIEEMVYTIVVGNTIQRQYISLGSQASESTPVLKVNRRHKLIEALENMPKSARGEQAELMLFLQHAVTAHVLKIYENEHPLKQLQKVAEIQSTIMQKLKRKK